MGFPQIRLNDRPVTFGLRKGLALLAYLVIEGRPFQRDEIAGLLWPEMDDDAARARLRRTLHKLQLAADGAQLIASNRATIAMVASQDVHVDATEFEQACDAGKFELALDHYGGDFLSGLSLDDCTEFEEWAFYRREALRSRLMQALEKLIERKMQEGDYREASSIAHRLVSLDPLNEAGHRHLIRSYILAGDTAAAQRQYQSCAELLEKELGVSPGPALASAMNASRPGSDAEAVSTCYASSYGVHIAYQAKGSGPPDIVIIPGFVTHVERIWDEPSVRTFLMALSQFGRLIIFDRRGVGLSDRIGAAPSAEATAQDIGTVMAAAGSHKAVLIGGSEGGPGCVYFAATAPHKVKALILYGTLAKGSWSNDYPFALTPAQYETWLRRLIRQWGGPAGIEVFAPSLKGNRQAESWWAGLLRSSSSPGAIKCVLEAMREMDVRKLLPRISVPTLVLHRTGDRAVRIEAGRHLAASINKARFVELPGADHWIWASDHARVIDEIRAHIQACAA
jgi:DNA-binding SARP family transcriptional activator/pimeloyl-ACP methyl ester carboxylesterase